jgi:hypothetical protein
VKRFRITWEFIREGTSEIKAESLDDAISKAGESVADFGDPKQFNEVVQWDTGWKVKSVVEVTEE